MLDRRFPTALQMMHSLAFARRSQVNIISSSQFAEWIGAHPALVRKLLKTLVDAGLVESRMGRHGGVSLARDPSRIALSEIYEAALCNKKIWEGRPDVPHRCAISSRFENYFSDLAAQADMRLMEWLGQITLEKSLDDLLSTRSREASSLDNGCQVQDRDELYADIMTRG